MAAMPKDPQKEERILAAALRVFAGKGLERGTISDIAEEAGIGKGTVYQYFSSKEEIFKALLVNFFETLIVEWQALIQVEADPARKLDLIISASFDLFAEPLPESMAQNFPVLLEIFSYAVRDRYLGSASLDLAGILRRMFATIEPLLAAGMEADIFRDADREYLSFLFFASLDGIAIHYYLQDDHYDLNKMKETAIEFYRNALLKNPEGV